MGNVGLFIDVNNVYQSLKHSNFEGQLDYLKLRDNIGEMGNITTAIAYGFEKDDEAHSFKCMLSKIGIRPKYRQKIPNRKSSWNTTICVDIMRDLDALDVIVVVSGDGDLVPVIKEASDLGRHTIVIGCQPSNALKRYASSTIEIYKDLLCD